MSTHGIVAAGHELTAAAGQRILADGGNAFDAAVAAFFTACVAEPVLASPGGGGFLLTRQAQGRAAVFDFFVQTPRTRRAAAEVDFHPVLADFGTATQEFHIGLGSIATPGCVRGMFDIHRRLCTRPMNVLMEPAIESARSGVHINRFQAYIASVIAPILRHSPELQTMYGRPGQAGQLLEAGDVQTYPALADTLDTIAREGDRFFYEGEPAAWIADRFNAGGQLTRKDFVDYKVAVREPLRFRYRNATILTNPLPSTGGALIRFLLKLMQETEFRAAGFGSAVHLQALAQAMHLTNLARAEAAATDSSRAQAHALELLEEEQTFARYRQQMKRANQVTRGTTHISVLDRAGNVASLTTSNGEGCGHLVPGTGVMFNNMLGEQDLNPNGFQQWSADTRMGSMMAPTLVSGDDRREFVLGSGGSNRIRTAIAQVLINVLDFELDLAAAIAAPRIHYEGNILSVEPGLPAAAIEALSQQYPDCHHWDESNLFFGGVHGAERDQQEISAAGDARRGGVP